MSNALQTLPAAQREVVILIGVLGVSYEEAAKICNCELGTVKSRLNRGRAALANILGDEVRPRPCYTDGGEERSSTPSDGLVR
jgi:DNA-directed RNA polymerase specialized sigma24 family protein